MNRTQIHFHWKQPRVVRHYRAAVSLHSHTMHSRETIAFVPRYAYGIPVLSQLVRRQERRYRIENGRDLDYSSVYWTPPLGPASAYQLERRQIEESLDLTAMMSLTDHDQIEAATMMQVLGIDETPISLEWTVPYRGSFFHLGVHNLPVQSASSLTSDLLSWSQRPNPEVLRDLLARAGQNATLVPVREHAEGLAALEARQVDAYASDRVILIGLATRARDPKRFVLTDRYFSYEPYALMLRRGDPDFRLAVDRVLARIYRSTQIRDIYARWFGALGEPGSLLVAMYAIEGLPE